MSISDSSFSYLALLKILPFFTKVYTFWKCFCIFSDQHLFIALLEFIFNKKSEQKIQ